MKSSGKSSKGSERTKRGNVQLTLSSTKTFQSRTQQISYQTVGTIERIKKILSSRTIFVIDIIVTIMILYLNDIKLLWTSKNTDSIFTIFSFVSMIIMIIEMILLFFIDENGYACGFYFLIDLLAAGSLTLDMHFTDSSYQLQNTPYSKVNYKHTQALTDLFMAIRVISRCLRFEKALFSSPTKKEMKFESVLNQRLTLFVLLALLCSIFTNPKVYARVRIDLDLPLSYLEVAERADVDSLFQLYIEEQSKTPIPVIYAEINEVTLLGNKNENYNLRYSEKYEYKTGDKATVKNTVHFILDNRYHIKLTSKLNMIRTTALVIIFIIGMVIFNRSVNQVAIEPTMEMIQKIKNLSSNPAESLQQNIDGKGKKKRDNTSLEVTMLGKAVIKLCGLVALGFGEAGSDIISSVVKKNVEPDTNIMESSKKIMGIYGFCDIRNFTDTTEVLQEKVMTFVNEVAEIVHEISAEYLGAANKNIGDAFLIVWKIDPKYTKTVFKSDTGETVLTLKKMWEVNQFMDMALIAFIKVIIQIKRSKKLLKYAENKDLNARMPNYHVKLGFGLHVGYSIEGPVGSPFKIDTSYLSPNVDLAGAIQERTKDFGKELILSQDFVDYLSPRARTYCVLLDDKSSDGPIYTVEMELDKIVPEESTPEDKNPNNVTEELNQKMLSIKEKKDRAKRRLDDAINNGCDVWEVFEKEEQFRYVVRK